MVVYVYFFVVIISEGSPKKWSLCCITVLLFFWVICANSVIFIPFCRFSFVCDVCEVDRTKEIFFWLPSIYFFYVETIYY